MSARRKDLALTYRLHLADVVPEDLDEILAIERASFPVPWRRDFFAVEVGVAFRFNRVARDARGILVGYLFCAHAAGEIHVNKLAVSAPWRRRGVAHRLMAEVLEFGERSGSEEMYLEVRDSNVAARNFYTSLGFVELDRRPGYYADGEDALVMLKRLPS